MSTVTTGVTLSLSAFPPIQSENPGHFRGQLCPGTGQRKRGLSPGNQGRLVTLAYDGVKRMVGGTSQWTFVTF